MKTAEADAPTLYATAMRLAASGDESAAIATLHRTVELEPTLAPAWRSLGDRLLLAGAHNAARRAYAYGLRAGVRNAALAPAASALCQGRLAEAEMALKAHVQRHPYDIEALVLLAEAAFRLGRAVEAEAVLGHALQVAPASRPAWHSLAILHYACDRWAQAVPYFRQLLRDDPREPSWRDFLAWCLVRLGNFTAALPIFEAMLADGPGHANMWLQYGHALKTVGRAQDAVAAYRRCLALSPGVTGAYISLADIKTFRFTEAECAAMRGLLADAAQPAADQARLHYALGAALEHERDFAGAFTHFAAGARCQRSVVAYRSNVTNAAVARARAVFTPAVLARPISRDAEAATAAPIFIVGLPRSGSTLIEQILASHSDVEGTMELTELEKIAGALSGGADGSRYPECLPALDSAALRRLGELYLENTKCFRQTARPHFIDKTPGNWLHAGLIHLILPGAKIIDIRRQPMAAGFAAFKQYFAQGHEFTNDLQDIGKYYLDYVALMADFDAVLPGRLHHVQYESLVTQTEAEIRKLLAYCGLPFEPACLRFWETAREIRTPSAEQVRQPIYAAGLEHWRHFEPWLSPLREIVG